MNIIQNNIETEATPMFASSAVSPLNRPVPEFSLPDHSNKMFDLKTVMGTKGVLMGFLGDIWRPVSVHRIFGLQRAAKKFAALGWQTALIVRDQPATLRNFHASSPMPVPFPLLADAEGKAHNAYAVERPCLLLIDRDGILRAKWQMSPDIVLPETDAILDAMHHENGDWP
jgi:peroxiredoxin